MKNKLEVGMYVRTKHLGGSIEKIIKILQKEKTEDLIERYVTDVSIKHFICIKENEILKSSYNIIDLIEVGDYVNGRYVDKYKGKLVVFAELPNGKWTTIDLDNEHYYIASILTKEQFSSMEYKVDE